MTKEEIVYEHISLANEYVNLPIDVETAELYVPIQERKDFILKRIEILRTMLKNKEIEERKAGGEEKMQNKTEYIDAIEDAKAAIIPILLRNNFNFDYCKSRNLTEGDLQKMDLDILFEHLGQKTSCDHAYNFYYFYQLQRFDEFKYYLNYNSKDRCLPEDRKNLLYLLDYLNLNKADINAYVNKQDIDFSIADLNELKLQIFDELNVSKNFVMNPHLITPEFKALLEQFNELQLLAIENEDKRLEETKTATVPVIKKIKNNISTLSNDEFINLYLLLDDLVIDPYESYGYYVIKNYMTTIIDKKM